jgi:alpha-L-fucosidase
MSRRRSIRRVGAAVLVAASMLLGARGALAQGPNGPYLPTWESVSQHPVPAWFDDAKLGIFIHWGLFSVPAWALPQDPRTFSLTKFLTDPEQFSDPAHHAYGIMPYAEWYYNTMQIVGSPTWEHHRTVYPNPRGPIAAYLDFIPTFDETSRAWQPDNWARLFQEVGARYVVLVTRHHDGFALWPSTTPNPHRAAHQQHAARDVVGELTDAVRARGLRMGLYYSGGIDWSFPPVLGVPTLPIRNVIDFLIPTPITEEYARYVRAHYDELIERYQPSVLWNDISNPWLLDAPALFADYYNRLPDGVVNDRWGPVPGWPVPHADFTTPENEASPSEINPKKWEATRAIGTSFAYNQNETSAYLLTSTDLVHLLVDTVSKNGNLLLGVGPAADGSIPPGQLEPLVGLGRWLAVNGAAIFDTRPWITFGCPAALCGVEVRYTHKGANTLYATLLSAPTGSVITFPDATAPASLEVTLLGRPGLLAWRQVGTSVEVTLPSLPPSEAYVLEFTVP